MFCPNGHENDPVCWLKWSGTVVCCLAAVSPRCQDNIPPRPHGDKVSDTYVLEMLMRYETCITYLWFAETYKTNILCI